MRDSSPAHHIIYGAGAVGGTLGILLHRNRACVTLVARPAVADAARHAGGLRFREAGREELVGVDLVTDPAAVVLRGAPRIHFTMKAGDLAPALERTAAVFGVDVPVVTWQNGIRAEEEAHARYADVIGGIVRGTSTMLVPGEVRIRTPGILIVGRYPPRTEREDPPLAALRDELAAAGYDAVVTPDIRSDKALKLLVNLFSGAGPLVRSDGAPTPELIRVECQVVSEGARVLAAAGIPFAALSGRGDDVPTMLRHIAGRPPRPPAGDGVHNSTWQNLSTPGRRLENGYMNGEIVTLARGAGLRAPWNERLLSVLEDVHASGGGPGVMTDREFGLRFADLTEEPLYAG